MAFKDILVHLDASRRSADRLALACDLVRRHEAHLTALYVTDPVSPALFYGDPAGPVDPQLIEEMMAKLREGALAAARPVEERFRDALRRDGTAGEWRLVEGPPAETVALHARYADLVVVGQPDPQEPANGATQIVAAALLSSGRPVLVMPYVGDFPSFGGSVLIGWKSSREAARAVNDAIPLLRRARSVTVLAINPRDGIAGDGDVPAADIALHLARHGITATADHTVAKDVPEGDVLLNYADEMGADLLVVGGYGHSRLREYIFGGVSRSLITEMTLPVLMSH